MKALIEPQVLDTCYQKVTLPLNFLPIGVETIGDVHSLNLTDNSRLLDPYHSSDVQACITSKGPEDWLREFEASGISPALALANVEWVDGDEAIEWFLEGTIASTQANQSYLTQENAERYRYYGFLAKGAWAAKPELSPVPYFKPVNPRLDTKKGKPVKYETPPKARAFPLLPIIPGHDWESPDGPILITEGLKKALSASEYGLPGIALRGITQWSRPRLPGDTGRVIWPDIAAAAAGRRVYVAFDQDEKVKTQRDSSKQALGLALALAAAGGDVRVMTWPKSQGKGIDDYLMGFPEAGRRAALQSLCNNALTIDQYRRRATLAQAAAILDRPSPRAAQVTQGDYLPDLPSLRRGSLHWIDAPMNSGKSYRIGKDWVSSWVLSGGLAVVLSPLNSLGMQNGKDWDLPHIHDYRTDNLSQVALEADISSRGGIVACFNSLHRVIGLLPQGRPILLILDEAAQLLDAAGEGGTLKGAWAQRWENFISLSKRAAGNGAIVLSEAGLDRPTIELVSKLSGVSGEFGIRHSKNSTPWDVQLHNGTPLSAFRADLLKALNLGEKILFVSSSQVEGRRVEKAAAAAGVKVIRIDSQTNEGGRFREFFESPDQWLSQAQPQLLILSPSAKTGLSIEGGVSVENAYFNRVFGYFPALDTDSHLQLLGRYRPAVPRVIWCPAYIQPGPDEKPSQKAINDGLGNEAAFYARAGGFMQSPENPDNQAISDYLADRRSRRWAQKVNPGGALRGALESLGHGVEIISGIAKDDGLTAQWKAIKEDIAREDSDYYAGLELGPEHTAKWANDVLSGVDSSYQERCKAEKVRVYLRFPGLDWNDSQFWYDAQFAPKDGEGGGPMAPGAALWAEAEHCQTLWSEDTKAAAALLTDRLKAVHLLPKSGVRAALAATFRPLVERLLEAGEVVPGGKIEGEIKTKALEMVEPLKRYWRLAISADQSDTAIVNKIAKKFGLSTQRKAKVTVGPNDRRWTYAIGASPVWRALVAARQWALTHGGTTLINGAFNKFVPGEEDRTIDQATSPPRVASSPPGGGPLPHWGGHNADRQTA